MALKYIWQSCLCLQAHKMLHSAPKIYKYSELTNTTFHLCWLYFSHDVTWIVSRVTVCQTTGALNKTVVCSHYRSLISWLVQMTMEEENQSTWFISTVGTEGNINHLVLINMRWTHSYHHYTYLTTSYSWWCLLLQKAHVHRRVWWYNTAVKPCESVWFLFFERVCFWVAGIVGPQRIMS